MAVERSQSGVSLRRFAERVTDRLHVERQDTRVFEIHTTAVRVHHDLRELPWRGSRHALGQLSVQLSIPAVEVCAQHIADLLIVVVANERGARSRANCCEILRPCMQQVSDFNTQLRQQCQTQRTFAWSMCLCITFFTALTRRRFFLKRFFSCAFSACARLLNCCSSAASSR